MNRDVAAPREKRVTIMMTKDDVVAVDNARYALRKPSRAEAIRFLIKKGLEAIAHERTGS